MSEHKFTQTKALVKAINGNMVTGVTDQPIAMNEVAFIVLDEIDKKRGSKRCLKAEIIRIRGPEFECQVFEDTTDIKPGHTIECTGELLSIELGPGLLGHVFDGLGNPLKKLAEVDGYFLKRGSYIDTLDKDVSYHFSPVVSVGEVVVRGQTLGVVKEGIFDHRIMVPFSKLGSYRVIDIAQQQLVNGHDVIAKLEHIDTLDHVNVAIAQKWPIKIPLKVYQERLKPSQPLATKARVVDALFPIAEGGTACIPGPFGSGKTVFQQSIARYSDADIVIIAACGERAGEVVEILREFPELIDPKTGRSLMERTIIICNTSSMPVAAREASVYTAMTMGEYYRQMGLRVLVLADSTSRWAQAVREMSGRLEEIPCEEAFPAYLGSLIGGFYERAGIVRIDDKNLGSTTGSLTLIGTVSPAGGNFEEPITLSTLAVVGCFIGLTYERSYAKRFPAVAPLDSWSSYLDSVEPALDKRYFIGFAVTVRRLKNYYAKGQSIGDQMKVVGEEAISLKDFVHYLKTEFFDAVFLQQNAFDKVDAAPSEARVALLLQHVARVVDHHFSFDTKAHAREIFLRLTALFREANLTPQHVPEYSELISQIDNMLNVSQTKDLATRVS